MNPDTSSPEYPAPLFRSFWKRCSSPAFVGYALKEFGIALPAPPGFEGLLPVRMEDGDVEEGVLVGPHVGLWEVSHDGFRPITTSEWCQLSEARVRAGLWVFYARPIFRFFTAGAVIVVSEIYGETLRCRKIYRWSECDQEVMVHEERTIWASEPIPT
jgi:hypothetical protein